MVFSLLTLPSTGLGKSSRIDAGFKYSAITIDNVLKYDILQNDGTYLNDERRSNQFIYDEKIGAVYAKLQYPDRNLFNSGRT